MRRLKQADRREAILAAATELFLEKGYTGVSVDAVIAEVGGSKRTFYAYFGDKDGLFAAIVGRLCAEIVDPMTHLDLKGRPLREALETMARTFLEVVLAPRTLGLHRLVVAEAQRFPEAARTFFATAPDASYRCLTEYFAWAEGAGLVKPGDARRRATLFLDALTGDLQLRCLLGLQGTVSAEAIDVLIGEAIEVFRGGIAAAGEARERVPATGAPLSG